MIFTRLFARLPNVVITLWPGLFPTDARRIKERPTFAILGRASVKDGALLYFPSIASESQEPMPLTDLRPEHSRIDSFEKVISVSALIVLLVIPTQFALSSNYVPPALSSTNLTAILVLLSIVLLLIVVFVCKNFIKMDQDWEKAIRQLFDGDTKSKMLGIQRIIMVFRRYVRWRRVMAYVLGPAWTILIIGGLRAAISFMNNTQVWYNEGGLLVLIVFILTFLVVAWYSYMRWYHTGHRDPTLQLCVMLAEENRNITALRQRFGVR